MLDLTKLGIIHTAISLLAVAAGITALIRDREITGRNHLGQFYIWMTVLTCLTGFPIVRHGFGAPHITGIITLITLAVAWQAGRGKWFGGAAQYVEVVGYSATFLFHMIPAFVETATRLPAGAPWVADRNGPEVQAATGILFALFLAGAGFQVRSIRRGLKTQTPIVTATDNMIAPT